MNLNKLFSTEIELKSNQIFQITKSSEIELAQEQTKDVFSEKWEEFEQGKQKEDVYQFQKEWFLDLYGFSSEKHFKEFLSDKKVIVDAGCGLGYKSAWFAELAPNAIVIGIDISDSVQIASKNYQHLSNLFFYQSDIASTELKENTIDFVVCDQVIMHTENPELTFKHLTDITTTGGEFACYVYRKKALPRELVDNHFRKATFDIPNDKLWEMSAQLTELGKRLSELDVKFESPDIPALGIKGGTYDIQRFIYWNFLKCFWREDWGKEMCDATNFDWYAPSNAKRYSKYEFEKMIFENKMEIISFHEEEACYSGRFKK
ncbi:MAG: class I SAM-dependent methyltransferase [Flavobacteriaceae bacterium]